MERAVLESAMSDFMTKARETERIVFNRQLAAQESRPLRFNIVIPIYRNAQLTQACIDSVIEHRSEIEDRIILIDDDSPGPEIRNLLLPYSRKPNIYLLSNSSNLGFVQSINRGLDFCRQGDIIILNSDTKVFAGGLEELWRVAHSSADIGTVTAISNNATIFSYPHPNLRGISLTDVRWHELAALALEHNRGHAIDVPTGHGFCMLVKQEVLQRIGRFDEEFGRGYGEENDLCARAADLGYRNVAAAGAFVAHYENTSFTQEKSELLSKNLGKLQARYPEHTPLVMDAERRDVLRSARWPLDAERLRRASRSGRRFTLVIYNDLGGGTSRAIADIEASAGYGASKKIALRCRLDGYLQLSADDPQILALFSPDEISELMDVLTAANITNCVVHQVLGFPSAFLTGLGEWLSGRPSVFYVHDFYAACPRVNLIDALGQFCNVPDTEVCARCTAIAGSHDASRTAELAPAAHRALFGDFLHRFATVVAPSQSASHYLKLTFPDLEVDVVPHPEPLAPYPIRARSGPSEEILLLGALGPHKGSGKLLEIATLARMRNPALRFHVVGYTDIDDKLLRIGNVAITGPYSPESFPELISRVTARVALFLSGWPETWAYTLSEALREGFFPLVPDLGALAERVRSGGFGAIFPFPIVAAEVLDAIARASTEQPRFAEKGHRLAVVGWPRGGLIC